MSGSEKWLPIPGDNIYEVSNQGRIRRAVKGGRYPMGFPLSHWVTRTGYCMVSLWDGQERYHRLIHRLVVAAFISPIPKGMQVNHKNGVKSDNHTDNLEVVTFDQNNQHAYDTGLLKLKLSLADVEEIKRRSGTGEVQQSIADDYGIARSYVSMIARGIKRARGYEKND